jgi:hypothetical protein
MSSLSAISALAKADLLERVRRYGFLVLTGCVLWLGYGAYNDTVHVILDSFTGRWNSAWAGGMMAMIANTFLTLCGFWFVKNAVERDERTGVGPILATTPLSRPAYVVGKALSHFLVLAAMAVVLFASALVIQLARGGLGPIAPLDYLGPLVLVVLPALALTAACAVFFETTPGLRGAFGNVLWMFVWGGVLAASMETRGPLADVMGLRALEASMGEAIRAQFPAAHYVSGLSISLGPVTSVPIQPFDWGGMRWTPAFLLSRVLWLAVALGLALLAAVPFHRFDPARARLRLARGGAPERAAARGLHLPAALRLPALPGLVGAELRLLFAGASAWWFLVAAGLWVAGLLTPLPVARSGILVALWVWGIPRWSSLGGCEARDGAEGFILPAPEAFWRQPLAAWTAGAIAAALLGLPIALRLALAGDALGLSAWTAGALFIPALALACGAWSGSHRLFEALYVVLWYLGPLNRVPALDYMGATLGAPVGPASPAAHAAAPNPGLWLLLAGVGLVLAVLARLRRLAG